MAGIPVASPLIGRASERAQITRALEGAKKGRGGALIISGPTGSGKSRLLDLLADEAVGLGFEVMRGQAAEGDVVPYSSFRRLLPGEDRRRLRGRSSARTADGGASGQISAGPTAVAGLGGLEPTGMAVGSRVGAGSEWGGVPLGELLGPARPQEVKLEELPPMGATVRLLGQLEEVADGDPVALILENVQWADPGSLALLRPLAREARKRAMLLAVAFESDESRTEEEGRELENIVRALQRESGALRIALHGLSPEESRKLVEGILEAPLVLEREGELPPVLARTGGNPFLIQEVVRAGLRDGWIVRRGEGYRVMEPTHDLQVPALLRWWVHRRIAPLLPDDRSLLEAISVLGSEFDPRALSTLLPSMEAVKRGLERLEKRHGLVHQVRPGLWRVEPAFLVSVVRAEMGGPLRRQLHRRAGEWQAAHDPGSVERIAAHYVQAGEPTLAMPWIQRSWQAAADRSDNEAALRFCRWGSEMARAANRPDEDMTWRVREGAALLQLGEARRAQKMLQDALAVAPEGLPRVAVLTQLALLEVHTGRSEKAFQLLAQAASEHVAPEDAGTALVTVASMRVDLHSRSLQWEQVVEEAPRLLEHADLLDERRRVRTTTTLGAGLTAVNRFAEARQVLLDALSQARRAGLVAAEANVRTSLGILAIHMGDLVVSRTLFEQVADEWGRRGGLTNQAINTANASEAMLLQGDLEQAEAWMERASALADLAGLSHLRMDMAPAQARCAILLGKPERARELLEQVLPDIPEDAENETFREAHASLALVHLALGDPEAAWKEAQLAGKGTHGAPGYLAARTYAKCLTSRGQAKEAEQLLLSVADEAQRLGRRMDHALTLDVLADLYRSQGRASEARVRWNEALGLLRASGALARAARVEEKRRAAEESDPPASPTTGL